MLLDEAANDELKLGTAKTLLLEGTELVVTWLGLFEVAAGDTAWDVRDVLLLASVDDAKTIADKGFAELLMLLMLLLMALLFDTAEVIVCVV